MKKVLLSILLLVGLLIHAQEKNLDYNNEPLEHVVRDIENQFQVRFSFNIKTLQSQYITHSGAITLDAFINLIQSQTQVKIQQIDSDNFVIIKSDEKSIRDLNFLDEVVIVSEYLTSGFDLNKKTGAITVKPNKLSVLPGLVEPDVLQSLQSLPGVASPTESASRLHIRGGTPDQNLILFDDITMYHDGHLFGMISPFNPFVTEQIEVFRSGASAEYGKRIAGVVNIKTVSDILDKLTGSFGANAIQSDLNISAPIIKDKLGVTVAGRRALTDIWDSFTFRNFSDKVFQNTKIEEVNNIQTEEELSVLDNTFNFYDVFAKIIYKPIENHSLSFTSIFVDNDLNHVNQDLDLEGSADNLKLKNDGFSLNWKGSYGKRWRSLFKLYYSDYISEYVNRQFDDESQEVFTRNNRINDFGLSAIAYYKPSDIHELSLGYDFSNYEVFLELLENQDDDTFTERSNTKQNRHTLFSEYNYTSDKWYVRAGLRANYFSDFDLVNFEPRFYSDYQLGNNFKVKISAEKRYQIISQLVSFDVNDLGLGNEVWALTNEDIPVLSNTQFTTGILFNNNGWKLDIEAYHKRIKGLSSLTRGFNTNALNTDNFTSGSNTIYGLDLLVKKRIQRFSFWLGYSLSKNELDFPEIQNTKFPGNFDQRHVFSLSNTFNYKRLQLSLGWQYATGTPFSEASSVEEFTNDMSQTDYRIDYDEQNGGRLPSYQRLDASVIYDFYFSKKRKLKGRVGASVMNILNRENDIDRFFSLDEDNSPPTLVQENSIGLNATANLVFRINF
ncbi:TonB-dependent receptor plug domain-containing protein [Winogradskyella haliclonae]|uniref:TonB-dependent receptor n=1 Tax=Winogradskyella haliclonae TaxID=2048558 RepID=A0ABQ2BTE5_9FLAO|nr:TonB-dependent receptor plug domain-containing protein [Winogradskyella haliclonae]GGI55731.1 TonB-dependent receptor [Winogradskyella haliclonae]